MISKEWAPLALVLIGGLFASYWVARHGNADAMRLWQFLGVL